MKNPTALHTKLRTLPELARDLQDKTHQAQPVRCVMNLKKTDGG